MYLNDIFKNKKVSVSCGKETGQETYLRTFLSFVCKESVNVSRKRPDSSGVKSVITLYFIQCNMKLLLNSVTVYTVYSQVP